MPFKPVILVPYQVRDKLQRVSYFVTSKIPVDTGMTKHVSHTRPPIGEASARGYLTLLKIKKGENLFLIFSY